MARKSAVLSTYPLDNLVSEVHRLLGPTWVLPPYNLLLPSYLKQPSSSLQQYDIDFLVRKGALDVPDPQFAQECFKAYIRHVHPHLPFLDLDLFSTIIFASSQTQNVNQSGGKVSLLLYQAVMFSGSFFVDLRHLYAAGFLSRRNALDTLFQRARLLYDLDADDDTMAAIQSLLLLTYWYDNPDKHKDGRHWMSICIGFAYKAQLHLDYSDHPDWNFRRILWWCIFTRDRLMSLGLQQPPMIRDQMELSIPVLRLDKDDIVISRFKSRIGISYYGENHDKLARIFVEKINLCRCIRVDLFSWNCQPTSSKPIASQSRRSCLWLSKIELEDWHRDLPKKISFCPIPFVANESDLLLYYHCAWLKMIYLEFYSTLHRQLDFLSDQYSPRQRLSLAHEDSNCPVLQSAIEFTEILQDLNEKHLTSYLTPTSVCMILRTGILHIQEVFTSNLQVDDASLRRLLHCILALQQLGSRYGGALFVASLFGASSGSSIVTSSPKDILAHVDVDSLGLLTSRHSEAPFTTVFKIREPYDVDIVSGLKSKVENLKIAAL
ncbi:hypothetical protein N7450_011121 [Penicillium hetheringtonii]|uniref:Xylanolytic transcriptional activator regulatory domain-containing protein n=1 Tax=Penicillium hetheringtonii TaxID=911720 RepID=A0AAD6DAC2_9EURO|nr:hypothetical protein N7450_011121 [Penicillium hetheringtonii]